MRTRCKELLEVVVGLLEVVLELVELVLELLEPILSVSTGPGAP